MRRAWRGGIAIAAVMLVALQAGAQEPWFRAGHQQSVRDADRDHMDTFLLGGLHFGRGDLEIRADSAVVRSDVDEISRRLPSVDSSGLPRRGLTPPNPRRPTSEDLLRQRLAVFMKSEKGKALPDPDSMPFPWALMQSMYLEGNVSVTVQGREVVRADSLLLSTVDDRMVLSGAELRLWGSSPLHTAHVFVVRGDKLVRQGKRTTGRDVSVTACSAGEPHIEILLGEVEIIEHDTDFEVRARGGTLAIYGIGALPLPNTSFFTSDQTNMPIRGASVGYSSTEGARAQLDLGGSFNPIGGALHEFFTGRAAEEFHGDWYAGLGFNQERGFPLEGGLVYAAPGLYSGRLDTFYLHDGGSNRREILNNLDNTPIVEEDRSMIHTENRVHLGDNTTLDLTLFRLGDPAVWSEFYQHEYREAERPESSVYLRHGVENRLLTASGRFNLNDFSYASDRTLADSFTEELPNVAFNLFSEEIAALPYGTPLLLTSGSSAGYFNNKFDETLPDLDQNTLRLDQELELAAPFQLGPVGVRPFASARITHYEDTELGPSDDRLAFAGGVSAGMRLARAWAWANGDGSRTALRHVMSPRVSFFNRYKVSGDPQNYFQFDETDSLTEGTQLRFDLLNRLQHRRDDNAVREFVWLDLAQTVTPISDSVNQGNQLGLLEYELVLRPLEEWVPIPGLRLLVEGEHDWNQRDARTFNAGAIFREVLGIDWHAEYRTDHNTDGSLVYGLATEMFNRWSISGRSQYDLERDEVLNYVVRIIRRDHDWQIHLGLVFNEITDETRFFINFEPSIRGLFKPRNRASVSGRGLTETSYAY